MARADPDSVQGAVLRDMQRWLEKAVIGLNLCPFAKAVHVRGQIHYVVSRATSVDLLEPELTQELRDLADMDPAVRDTTLLVVPDALVSFLDFNDFLYQADRLLNAMDLEGVLQIASFHPQFQFAGTAADDISNATNRAPYPTLHLLREASVDKAVAAFPQADSIFDANIATLEQLGQTGWDALNIERSVPEPPALPLPAQPRRRRGTIR